MSQGTRFVVEVVGRMNEGREVTVSRVRDALGLDETKASALVARMPGVITRPAGEERSMRIALSLQAAGVPALHRPVHEQDAGFRSSDRLNAAVVAETPTPAEAFAQALEPAPAAPEEGEDFDPAVVVTPLPDPVEAADPLAGLDLGHRAETEAPAGERDPLSSLDTATALDPYEALSVDATYHQLPEPDPKLTPMTEAGFGAADIVLPTDLPTDLRDTSERLLSPPPRAPRTPRPSLVEAGPTSSPDAAKRDAAPSKDGGRSLVVTPVEPAMSTPAAGGRPSGSEAVDPVHTMVRSPDATPTPLPDGEDPTPAAAARAAAERALRSDRSEPPRPRDSGADARKADPVYRQTRSSAEPSLSIAPPPDEALKRTGVSEDDLARSERRRRGRFARRLAALVTLPVLLSWGLAVAAMWFLLPEPVRDEHFQILAAAAAVAALVAALFTALATGGVSRDVVRLRDAAKRVAMGELSDPIELGRKDELGDVAQSLDRMRVSLQESLERLRKRRG